MHKKILAIGAHFDDIEIGVGGTLIKHIDNGDTVYLAITEWDEHRTGDPDIRMNEQRRALKVLNIPEKNLLVFKTEMYEYDIVGILDQINPTTIYTMYAHDTHQAHRKASSIGQAVGRKLTSQVVFYNSGTSVDFSPNVFSIIDFETKQDILKCFESQINLKAVNIDFIKRRESYWASLITDKQVYAEGFVIRKMIYNI
jgi:LmbE family N-acetylglucosaminyl deacetylase